MSVEEVIEDFPELTREDILTAQFSAIVSSVSLWH
jgi:uncharacterized protein (DUF433 family)